MDPKKKLTLALPEQTIRRAKAYARRHRTSVSALVTRFFDSVQKAREPDQRISEGAVITESSVGMVHLPLKKKSQLIAEALADKYSSRK